MSDEEGCDFGPFIRGLYNTSGPRLKPCPFCGSLTRIRTMVGCPVVVCTNVHCQAMGPLGDDEDDAVERWNAGVME